MYVPMFMFYFLLTVLMTAAYPTETVWVVLAQFFINVADNRSLNPKPDRWGYAVFGYVIEGMDVVERIANVRTGPGGRFKQDVPVAPVIITRASRVTD